MRSAAAALLAFAVCSACARDASAQRRKTPLPAPAPPEPDEGAFVDTSWRQILMAPRITGNLRAVAVDPSEPKNVYVGTEEGTIIHSNDGGVTWDETELSPFLLQSPTVPVLVQDTGIKAVDVFAGFNVLIGTTYYPLSPLYRRMASQIPPVQAPNLSPLPPYFINPIVIIPTPEPLLASTPKDPKPYEEVRRIRICPGGPNRIFVITESAKLWGSPDGATFLPLYIARQSEPITDVACAPSDPSEVIMTKGDAVLRSTDGGASFETAPGALGGASGSALVFGPAAEGERAPLYVASGRDVWIGDPSQPDGMRAVQVGGEGDVNQIAVGDSGIWAATETGVRVSRDGGATWSSIAELEGSQWTGVAVAPPSSAEATEHVLVLGPDIAFESADGGKSFTMTFRAESRRRLRQIASATGIDGDAGRFLLVTSGELWTTKVVDQGKDAVSPVVRRWAERRLRTMPPLGDVVTRALVRAKLTDVQVDGMFTRLKTRAWLPGAVFNVSFGEAYQVTARQASVTDPTRTLAIEARRNVGVIADLVWELPDLVSPSYQFPPARKDLYELRTRYEYIVEDAYDERKQVLTQLATAALDAEQVLSLQTRVELLDLVIHEFTAE